MVDNKISLLPKLSQNLLESLNDEEYYDVTIEVGKVPYIKVFRAHMIILHHRSPYLRRILSINKKKNDGTLVHIKLPEILPDIFQIILRYIYGGELSLDEYDNLDIIKILVAANKLGLQEIIDSLQTFLIKNKALWMEQNFNIVYQTSFENNSFLDLQNFCTNLIARQPDKLFKSLKSHSIPEKLLISLIKNDNLQMKEIQVWEHVINWGLDQNPTLPSNLSDFSKDDFNVLKNTLQKCIPHVRFQNLTSKEFSDKVLPYKKILSKELYTDLLRTFLNSNYKKNLQIKPRRIIKEISSKTIDSKIITYQHIELISKWIDRSEIKDNFPYNPYEFKLIYRGSRDGLTFRRFHDICDGKTRTVTIARVKDTNEVLGGYNPISWKSDASVGATKNSFIFSLNLDKIENCILSRVKYENHAINNFSYFGPTFGNGDLKLLGVRSKSDRCVSKRGSYEKPIRKNDNEFFVNECEVFRII
ncbi:carbohydrate-binding module family 13 protein [Rhizophagus clarus]|uniref:Carbohydrate-binding module family 13 protein n=1 Tax=Rhizophagus clarus TaxID=94130 RepID=A0A8H3M609_9GLOM|nr:carbohydrate-binding module family 13 protein [Rhizophagus clarus]